MKALLIKLRQYLLSGVSFAIPFIACGGILIAAAIACNEHYSPNAPGVITSSTPVLKLMFDVGVAAFTLMPVVLSGYIAYAMAGKPGLVSGMVGGWLATHLGCFVVDSTHQIVAVAPAGVSSHEATAGFLGSMLSGLLAGYVVMALKKLPAPKFIKPIMPILIIPIISSLLIGAFMLKVAGVPIAELMGSMGTWLDSMGKGNAVVLAMILGAMIALDMGGPINKAAFFFGAGELAEGHYTVMGCIAAAICVPPLGMGLATIVGRRLWSDEEREAGIAAVAMGMIGITEGAISFAASDPLRVIPCIMAGSSIAAIIAMLGRVGDHAPHGGPIVLPVVDHPVMYVIAIVSGTCITATIVNLSKLFSRSRQEANEPAEPSVAAVSSV